MGIEIDTKRVGSSWGPWRTRENKSLGSQTYFTNKHLINKAHIPKLILTFVSKNTTGFSRVTMSWETMMKYPFNTFCINPGFGL